MCQKETGEFSIAWKFPSMGRKAQSFVGDLWETEMLPFLLAGERWLCFCQVLPSTYLEEVLALNLSTSLFPLKHSRFGR